MRTILFFVLLFFSETAWSENTMSVCQKELKTRCADKPFQECLKEKKLSKNCMNMFSVLQGFGKEAGEKCMVLLNLCPIDTDKLNEKNLEQTLNNVASCVEKNKSKIPAQCQKYMDYINSPLMKELFNAQFNG